MAKSNHKKRPKERIIKKEENSIQKTMLMYALRAVLAIVCLIAAISALSAVLTDGDERNAIYVPSPQLEAFERPFFGTPTNQRTPKSHHRLLLPKNHVAVNTGAPRIFKRAAPATTTPTVSKSPEDSCNCNYSSPLKMFDQTSRYTYIVYPKTSTTWPCAFVCCEKSPLGRAILAKLDNINSVVEQFRIFLFENSLSPWAAVFCFAPGAKPGNSAGYDDATHGGQPTQVPGCDCNENCSPYIPSPVIVIPTTTALVVRATCSSRNSAPLCQIRLPETTTSKMSTSRLTTSGSTSVTTELITSSKTNSTSSSFPASTPMTNTDLLDCPNVVCLRETTKECSLDGHKCVCMSGWTGIACQRPIDHCSANQCRFGRCINHNTSYECQCLSGYGGEKCDISMGRSTDPLHIYNAVVQRLGCIWVLISAGFSFIVLTALRDCSPISCLARHSLVALFCEHLMMAFFHDPALFNFHQQVCHWMSLVILYFRGVHMLLTLFLTYHIHYIMTGVTSGQWGWNGDWRIFETMAWGSPIFICLSIWAVSFPDLATGFTCMMNWETRGVRWFLLMLPIMLLSLSSLEQAHSEMHFQHNCTGSILNSMHLLMAQVTRWGMYFLTILAPLTYVTCSYAVFTGSPVYFSFEFGCNVALGICLFGTFVVTNQYAWCLLIKWFQVVQKRVTGRKNEETSMEMSTPVENGQSRYERRMIGRFRYTWS